MKCLSRSICKIWGNLYVFSTLLRDKYGSNGCEKQGVLSCFKLLDLAFSKTDCLEEDPREPGASQSKARKSPELPVSLHVPEKIVKIVNSLIIYSENSMQRTHIGHSESVHSKH